VNYELRAKFLRKFLPSLVEGSRAAWCGGASGDEGRNYIMGDSTIGYTELQCCINSALRPLTFNYWNTQQSPSKSGVSLSRSLVSARIKTTLNESSPFYWENCNFLPHNRALYRLLSVFRLRAHHSKVSMHRQMPWRSNVRQTRLWKE
jgi:hypothetical protein